MFEYRVYLQQDKRGYVTNWVTLTNIHEVTIIRYTGRFIMFSVITNIYNKKTKGPTLMEFFTATGKLKKFFFFTTRDIRCVHHGWQCTHRYDIQVLATHASGRSFDFLAINVCNQGEHYETPCIWARLFTASTISCNDTVILNIKWYGRQLPCFIWSFIPDVW